MTTPGGIRGRYDCIGRATVDLRGPIGRYRIVNANLRDAGGIMLRCLIEDDVPLTAASSVRFE